MNLPIKIVDKWEYQQKLKKMAEMEARIAELSSLLRAEQAITRNTYLGSYRYAILVDEGYHTILWNQGREEYGVKEIHFEAEPGYTPTIVIEK